MAPRSLSQALEIIARQDQDLVQLRAHCRQLETKISKFGQPGHEPHREIHKEFLARDSELGSHDPDSSALIRAASLGIVTLVAVDFVRDRNGAVAGEFSSLMIWGFRQLPLVLSIWFTMNLVAISVVPAFALWFSSRISSPVHLGANLALQFLLWIGSSLFILLVNLAPPCALIVMTETVRLSMKMYAFMVETRRYAILSPDQIANKELHLELLSDNLGLFQHYLYFLFAPTLVYRNTYPRTSDTNWCRVASHISHLVIGIVLTGYIFCSTFLQEPGWHSWSSVMISVLSAMIPGMALMILAFFAILHSWFNAFAEILRFADRQFYLRWWTARSYSSFYRQWNKVVGDWIHAYIYSDLKKIGVGQTKAMIYSFIISAIVHEYIIAMSLRFCYPVMFVMFAGFGTAFIFFTNNIRRNSVGWNWFLWSTLFFGNGLILMLYSAEYIARSSRIMNQYNIDQSSWIPYSWQIFLQHQQYHVF